MRARTVTALVAAASLSVLTACSSGDADTAEDVVADPPSKTWEDAVEASRQSFDGKVDTIELERGKSGTLEYEVEQFSATQESAVRYDADSLERTSEKIEDLDADDAAEKQKKAFDPSDLIGLDEAAKTAREEVDGTITKWKAEGKDTGQVIYEFDIAPRGAAANADDAEVQVDAKDGSIFQDS